MESQTTSELLNFFLAARNKRNTDIREFLRRILVIGIDFKASEIVSAQGIDSGRNVIAFEAIPETGLSYDKLAQAFSQIASKSSNWRAPSVLGFLDAGNNVWSCSCYFCPLAEPEYGQPRHLLPRCNVHQDGSCPLDACGTQILCPP